MGFDLQSLVRENIRVLKPYSSARHEFSGQASVFLDANENSFGSPVALPAKNTGGAGFNRYPDPLQQQLKSAISSIKEIAAENIFIGNGSDEVIDLAYRIFCQPGRDNVIICPPTYGMYEVSGHINDVEVRKAMLTNNFQLDRHGIRSATDANSKLLFICSPNNPTGNSMDAAGVKDIISDFPGIVIIDEAYIDFAQQDSFARLMADYPNLLVMQTLSKAWGIAALRLGLAFASTEIIALFNKVKPPYNINEASQELALTALRNRGQVEAWTAEILQQRELLKDGLSKLPLVERIFPSEANFLLLRVSDADKIYTYLSLQGIVVRNRSHEPGCGNCLRITVGTAAENIQLIKTLQAYEQ